MSDQHMYATAILDPPGVLMTAKSALAEVVERWKKEQRLEWAQLARLADVSRGTLNNIRQGQTVQSDTLRKLARGFATHPHTDVFDPVAHNRALRDLFEAGGLIAIDELPRPNLRVTVSEIMGAEKADQVDDIVRELAKLPPHLQDRWLDMARVTMAGIQVDATGN